MTDQDNDIEYNSEESPRQLTDFCWSLKDFIEKIFRRKNGEFYLLGVR